jgi:hypothetical protein
MLHGTTVEIKKYTFVDSSITSQTYFRHPCDHHQCALQKQCNQYTINYIKMYDATHVIFHSFSVASLTVIKYQIRFSLKYSNTWCFYGVYWNVQLVYIVQ